MENTVKHCKILTKVSCGSMWNAWANGNTTCCNNCSSRPPPRGVLFVVPWYNGSVSAVSARLFKHVRIITGNNPCLYPGASLKALGSKDMPMLLKMFHHFMLLRMTRQECLKISKIEKKVSTDHTRPCIQT